MAELIDLTGKRFGKLLVINKAPTVKGRTKWLCQCDCGNTKIIGANELKRGETNSCGCIRHQASKQRKDFTNKRIGHLTVIEIDKTHDTKNGLYWICRCDCGNYITLKVGDLSTEESKGQSNRSCGCVPYGHTRSRNKTKGVSNTRLYKIWFGMKTRCKSAKNYAGKGIKVCEKWRNDFNAFSEWAFDNGYRDDLTIDRIDVNGDYEPDNCRWITNYEQQSNKSNNVFITYKGETKTASQWGRLIGMSPTTISERVRRGWNAKMTLETPVGKR